MSADIREEMRIRNECMSALIALGLAVDSRISDDVRQRVTAYIDLLERRQAPKGATKS